VENGRSPRLGSVPRPQRSSQDRSQRSRGGSAKRRAAPPFSHRLRCVFPWPTPLTGQGFASRSAGEKRPVLSANRMVRTFASPDGTGEAFLLLRENWASGKEKRDCIPKKHCYIITTNNILCTNTVDGGRETWIVKDAMAAVNSLASIAAVLTIITSAGLARIVRVTAIFPAGIAAEAGRWSKVHFF